MTLSIGQAWSEAKGVLARDGGVIAVVALALLVLPGVVIGVAAPPGSALAVSGLAGLLALLTTLIAFAGQIAIARIALGPPLTVGQAIAVGFRRLVPFFVAWFLWLLPFILAFSLLLSASGIDLQSLQAQGAQPGVPAGVSIGVLLLSIALLVVAARMLLLTPLAAAERLGPVAMLKRSWQLSRGRALKLFGLLALIGLLFVLLVFALGSAIGSVILLIAGQPEPWSMSALLLALLQGVLTTVVTVISAVLLARIYAQLSAGPATTTVPHAGGE